MDKDLHRSRLFAAIIDRLTFGGNIIETGTDSYRLAHTKKQAGNRTLTGDKRPFEVRYVR